MDPVLDRIRRAVPGLTSGRIHAMAGDVAQVMEEAEGDEARGRPA